MFIWLFPIHSACSCTFSQQEPPHTMQLCYSGGWLSPEEEDCWLQQWHSRNVIVGFHSIRTTERKCIPFIRCSLQIPQKFIGIKTTRVAMAFFKFVLCVLTMALPDLLHFLVDEDDSKCSSQNRMDTNIHLHTFCLSNRIIRSSFDKL